MQPSLVKDSPTKALYPEFSDVCYTIMTIIQSQSLYNIITVLVATLVCNFINHMKHYLLTVSLY